MVEVVDVDYFDVVGGGDVVGQQWFKDGDVVVQYWVGGCQIDVFWQGDYLLLVGVQFIGEVVVVENGWY